VLTKEDYVDGLRTVMGELGRQDPYRDRRVWEQLAAFTLLFIVLFAVFRDAGMAVLVTLLAQVAVNSALGELWVRRSTGASYDRAMAHSTVSVFEDGLEDRTADRTRKWNWPAVRHVHDTGAALVFEMDGWDMLILPRRLWPDDQSKGGFLREARRLVPPRADSARGPAPDLNARDMLQVGAIAAGIDVLFATSVLADPAARTNGYGLVALWLAIGVAAAYCAYRLVRSALLQLHAQRPRLALTLSQLLVLAVPLYILTAYLGWL
jgi:hypothetical protein